MPKKTATKPKAKDKSDKPVAKDETLETVNKDFKSSWDYCAGSWHDRWDNNNKLYNNERVKRGYQGITDTFVPMAFSTVETLTSALFGMKPKFNFLAPRSKPDQKTDILNSLVDFYWDKDQWSIKVINTGRGMLKLGNGIDYFCWNGDHPKMINVPLRDFFIDPTCTTLENARYMGRRFLITKEELETYEIVDLEGKPDDDGNYPMKKKYKNLDQIKKADSQTNKSAKGTSQETTDQQEKNNLYGSTLSDTTDQIEVLEYWTNDNVFSVANRKVVIENTENYYKAKAKANAKAKDPDATDYHCEGLMPFAGARDYVDESLFYAKGEIDFIFDQQELLNDITNQNIDSITFTLNQMYTLDPKYGDQIQTVENLPGAVYPFEAGALTPIPQRPVPPDAFNERMNIKNEIRETTASNEVVKGVGEQQGGKATATEINAQIAGAGQRINLKITQIENEYFHRMARIVFAMIRLYVTEPMMVRIVGKDGARWEEFDPKEYAEGDYEPRVQLDISIENQKAETAAEAKEMMAAFLNDQHVNQLELKKLVLAKGFQLDPDEVELLMTPMEPEPGMGMDGTMPPLDPGAMPPELPPMSEEEMMPASMMEPPAGMPEEDLMMEPPAPEAEGPEIFIDPETGDEYMIDPATGEYIPMEATVAA